MTKESDIKILYAQERGDEFAIVIEINGKRYDGYLRVVEGESKCTIY